MQWVNRLGRHFWKWTVVFLLMISTSFLVNAVIGKEGRIQVAVSPQEAAPAYTAIILGARVYESGHVSPVLMDRLDTGVELYE